VYAYTLCEYPSFYFATSRFAWSNCWTERHGVNPRRKCIVSHYPLCDNVLPYSMGIHTVWVRFLDNSELARFSGIWFEEVP
jgi:hypothetical protein